MEIETGHGTPGYLRQSEIKAAVAEVEQLLAPDVVHIRYEVTHDWSGDWAVYFRVLLSDEASKPPRLHEIAQTVEREMSDRLDFLELGLFYYFHYRSQSEQNKIKEKIWA